MNRVGAVLRWLWLLTLALNCMTAHAAAATCTGKFLNPITDICWSCILPLSIGAAPIGVIGSQEDIPNPASPVCSCGLNPTIGLNIGFWEPARHVETTRSPFCLSAMGGINLDPGIDAPEHGRRRKATGAGPSASFYQAHWYINPVMFWMEVVTDFPCLEKAQFDLGYLTEVDPLWNDDELTLIMQPEAILFANPISVAACAADCVAASVGFGFKSMFWCAGCQGGVYPLDGWIPNHLGGVRSAELLAHRLTSKMHREFIAWGWHGSPGLCGPYFLPAMDKTAYKLQLTHPIPRTGSQGASHGADATYAESRCCQPFGRTTLLWGAGKEYPVRGEDFGFMLFRKRNCCVGY